jgi:hypothetical protein
MKHAFAYLITARAFAAASLVAATYATAMAQSGSAPQVLPHAVTLAGTISVRELSASAANRQTPQTQQNPEPNEAPLPGGVQISPPSKEMLERLPLATEPNAGVGRHIPFRQISGFTGITLGSEAAVGANATPPDQGLAVHDNIVAEIVNRSVQFFKSDGTPLTNPILGSVFFLTEGLLAAGTQVHDPQAFFDPKSKRWYFHAIIPTVPNMVSGAIGLAVSQSSDPLGTYFIYHIRRISDDLSVCGGVDCFPDYPHGGYDAHALFISTRLFSGCATCFIAAVYVLPKAQLEAGLRVNESLTIARFLIPENFVVQPSIPAPHEPFETANGGIEYLLGAPSSDLVRVFAISNTSEINRSPSSLQLMSVDVPTEPFAKSVVPSAQPNIVGPTCASQGVTSAPSLNADPSEFQATIQKAGGNLYGVLPFGSQDGNGFSRNVLAWFILRPTLTSTPSLTANIVAQGYIVPPDGYSLIYPAFAVNKAGKGLIGFTISNPDANAPGGFPSAAVIEFAGFPRGNIIVTGQGATSYDARSACSRPGPGGVGLWGDYGAATVDAATGFFYLANEYIPDPTVFPRSENGNWGTFITQVAPAGRPVGPSRESEDESRRRRD